MRTVKVSMLLLLITMNIIAIIYDANEDQSLSIPKRNIKAILPQDIIFEYNSTYQKVTYTFELDLDLGEFNSLSIFFVTSGDRSLTNKLKVTIQINNTEVDFTIPTFYQDQNEHNLTKGFFYPELFAGLTNVTIFIEGQASLGQSGSLTLFNNLSIEKLEIPTIGNNTRYLPVAPSSLEFRGSAFYTKRETIQSAFKNNLTAYKLNISLVFTANNFESYSQHVELVLNETVLALEEFKPGKRNNISFLIDPIQGLSNLTFNFVIDNSIDVIKLTDIAITGHAIAIEDIIPDGIFDYCMYTTGVDYKFDLTAMKPAIDNNKQILKIKLECSIIGPKFSPALYLSIISGTTEIYEGEISDLEQSEEMVEVNVFTYTYSYKQSLYFRIHGVTNEEGQGFFLIYNTSTIETEPIPELKEDEILERELDSEEVIETPRFGMKALTYRDVFFIDYSFVIDYDFNLSFDLLTQYDVPIDKIVINLEIGLNATVDTIIYKRGHIEINERLKLYQGYNEVKLVFAIYGEGAIVTLRNIKYQLQALSSNNTTNSNEEQNEQVNIPIIKPPVTIVLGVSSILGQWMFLGLFIRIYSSKKKKDKITEYRNEDFKLEVV
ncbi:MAG: hypothetical protein ACTSQE_11615 [Candidatus Heimdallarchaeaceae archaeon]